MAQATNEILAEIAKKLNLLKCICSNTSQESSIIVEDYQVKNCNEENVGDPMSVMPVIVVNKQLVEICEVDYDTPRFLKYTSNRCINDDDNIDISKLHSVSFSVTGTTGTVTMHSTLNGTNDTITSIPIGYSSNIPTTTTFGTGDLCFSSFTGDVAVFITLVLSA